MRSFDSLSIDEIYCKYGQPQTTPIKRLYDAPLGPEVPPESVIQIWLGVVDDKLMPSEASIWSHDFGEAFRPDCEEQLFHVSLVLFAHRKQALSARFWYFLPISGFWLVLSMKSLVIGLFSIPFSVGTRTMCL